ncbi:MAG: TIGR00266 family protein [Thermosphaera sp.]
MEWRVEHRPSYSILKVKLNPGERVYAEPGAMVYMSSGVQVETKAHGGIVKSLLRTALAGESFFINTYYAREPGEAWFAPSLPGDISYVELKGDKGLVIQDTSYIAHHGDVNLTTAWRGLRGLIAEGELVWLKAEGKGGVWISSYGAIEEVNLKPGEKVLVDNFHFVAMDDGIKWDVKAFGGVKSFILGGEGFVVEVTGPGRLYVQTRSLSPLIEVISKYLGRRK